MKKYLPIILLLLIALILPSCAGIGDGALFDNIQTSGESNVSADDDTTSIKPDRGVLITIDPKPEGHDLSVEDAAEIYKLLMTADRQVHDEPVRPTTSMETIQVIFNNEYGRAAFYVNKDDAVGYYEGFLDGEHAIYFKIEGIHKKLMDYIK
jgi:hypothetical protein